MQSKNKIQSLEAFSNTLQKWKNEGETIVFTNGCFDLVHVGHVDYLEKSKALGTKLIVGVNTDASVSRFKGPSRPIANEQSRYRVLAAMEFIDAVIPFNDDTPLQLISAIVPNVLVKGNDYLAEETDPKSRKYIVGSDIVRHAGGKVTTVELIEGFSTSLLIEKIKQF